MADPLPKQSDQLAKDLGCKVLSVAQDEKDPSLYHCVLEFPMPFHYVRVDYPSVDIGTHLEGAPVEATNGQEVLEEKEGHEEVP